jgi:ATP:corrinoid adenosyltransferase
MEATPTPYTSEMQELNAMRSGISWRIPVKLRNFTIYLRPLTITENNLIDLEVQKVVMGTPITDRTPMKEATLRAKEIIKMASTPDVNSVDQGIYDKQLDLMTNDEIIYLNKQYMVHCERVNPAMETMPAEQLHRLVDALKKTPVDEMHSILTELSLVHLVSLVRYFLTKEG